MSMSREGFSRIEESGSVLTEFVVVAGLVLVPLVLVLPILFKYIENRQYIEQAARYSVWEKTAYYHEESDGASSSSPVKGDAEIRREIDNRIFSDGNSVIARAQREPDHVEEINPNLTFRDRSDATTRPIYDSISSDDATAQWADVSVENEVIGGGGTLTGALSAFTSDIATLGTSGFSLESDGLYTSAVSVDMAEVPYFDELKDVPLFSRSGTLIANGWSQGGPSNAASAARSLNPLARWGDGAITDVINDVGSILSVTSPYLASIP